MSSTVVSRATSGGSRAVSRRTQRSEESEEPEPINLQEQPEIYFDRLNKLAENADKIQKEDMEQTQKLLEYLPINEKFSLNKEGKVLTRWQERQRDWDRIQNQIQRKLNSKSKRPLMMSTSDEHRCRMEEMDLIQAALPVKDRFQESQWQLTLRGGGPISVAIGHIFSGLECQVDMHFPNPKMIRKPKPPQNVFNNDTFLGKTESVVMKQKKYEKTIKSLRPVNLTYQDAGQLVVRSRNLFKWAKESSDAWFKEKEEAARLSIIEEESSPQHLLESSYDSQPFLHPGSAGPKIELHAPVELFFEAQTGRSCTRVVTFKNIGSTGLTYHWRRAMHSTSFTPVDEPDATPKSIREDLKNVLRMKCDDGGRLRSHRLYKEREHFFCMKSTGFVLPNEQVSTSFIFRGCAGEGAYKGAWVLEFVPEDTAIFAPGSVSMGIESGVSAVDGQPSPNSVAQQQQQQQQQPMSMRSITINFNGFCINPDENVRLRKFLGRFFDRAAVDAMAQDIVYECLHRVRDPIRLPNLQQRQIDYFRTVNESFLHALSERYGKLVPTFIVPERLDIFCAHFEASMQQLDAIVGRLNELRIINKRNELVSAGAEGDGSADVEVVSESLRMTEAQLQSIRSAIFPENNLEIFDTVTEEQITPRWNYDIAATLEKLTTAQKYAEEIGALEEKIQLFEKMQEKARLKEERRAARRAAGDSDDEDSDGEEEEEEEDDEDKPEKPLHPLVRSVVQLQEQLWSDLNLLMVHQPPYNAMEEIARSCLMDLLDTFLDIRDAALEKAEILEVVNVNGGVLPTLPSPYTSEEGAAAWAHMLQTGAPEVEEVGKGGKGKGGKGGKLKAAKKPPKKGVAPTTDISEEEAAQYYYHMTMGLKAGLLDAGVKMFDGVGSMLREHDAQHINAYTAAGLKLMEVSVLRPEDLHTAGAGSGGAAEAASQSAAMQNKLCLINFDGDAFAQEPAPLSAFDKRLNMQLQAIAPILKLAEYNASAAVLLYESSDETNRLLPHVAEVKTLVQKKWESYQEANNRALKKLKQKPPAYKAIKFISFSSYAEFYHMCDFLQPGNMAAVQGLDGSSSFFAQNFLVVVLENVHYPGVIPVEPEYEEVLSDDEEAPVSVGLEESVEKMKAAWAAKRPHRVEVAVDCKDAELASKWKAAGMRPTKRSASANVNCYADAAAALAELVTRVSGGAGGGSGGGDSLVWIEASPSKLFDAYSAFGTAHECVQKVKTMKLKQFPSRFVSQEIREAFLWASVLQLLPQATPLLDEARNSAAATEDEGAAEARADVGESEVAATTLKSTTSAAASHFAKVFPYSARVGEDPVSMAVIGGTLRAEKFSALDQLIGMVDCISIVGEMAIAFTCLSSACYLKKHARRCAPYRDACLKIVGKARALGCELVLPVDFAFGDEELTAEQRMKCYTTIDPDSRTDAFEYEGELKYISVVRDPADAADTIETKELDGYAYDIGPQTISLLTARLQSVSMALFWGSAGVVEASSFQAGQQALCTAAKIEDKLLADLISAPAELEKNPLRSILIGDSCVEWFSRILDSDGEYEGDLVGAGFVSYSCSNSSLFNGLMGLFPSHVVTDTLSFRPAVESEWVYSRPKPEEEDDDDDDEDEEEEEDD